MKEPITLTKAELIEKLEDIEWEDFEVKEAKDAVPKNSWETVSAFSNTAGGWLVFGVQKKGKSYHVVGISNPEKTEQDFTTTLRGEKFNRKIDVGSKKYDLYGKTVLAFYIPQRFARDKPIYFNSPKNTFIRTASGDQRATPEEINSFYRASSFDDKDRELTDYGKDDLDAEAVKRYRNYFANINPGHKYNTLSNDEFLHKQVVVKDDRVTYGGLLVFGTADAISGAMANYRVEYLEVPGVSYEDGPTRYTHWISSEQGLFTTFFDIYERLLKRIDIPFNVSGGVRDDDPPHVQALREALVNLLIHTDYFSRTNPRIRSFSDRIEFFNPGSLPKELKYILKEDFSLPRNPTIAKIFRFIRLAENIGSGFHKMIDGWEYRYGSGPKIEGDFDYYKSLFHNETLKHNNLS